MKFWVICEYFLNAWPVRWYLSKRSKDVFDEILEFFLGNINSSSMKLIKKIELNPFQVNSQEEQCLFDKKKKKKTASSHTSSGPLSWRFTTPILPFFTYLLWKFGFCGLGFIFGGAIRFFLSIFGSFFLSTFFALLWLLRSSWDFIFFYVVLKPLGRIPITSIYLFPFFSFFFFFFSFSFYLLFLTKEKKKK